MLPASSSFFGRVPSLHVAPLLLAALVSGCAAASDETADDAASEGELTLAVADAKASAKPLPVCKNNGTGWAWPWEYVKWTRCERIIPLLALGEGRSFAVRLTLSQKAVVDVLQGKNGVGWAEKDESYRYVLATGPRSVERELGGERSARYLGATAQATADGAAFVVADFGGARVDAFRANGEELPLVLGRPGERVLAAVDATGEHVLAARGGVEADRVELAYVVAEGASVAAVGQEHATTLTARGGRIVGAYEYDVRWPSGCGPTATLYAPPPEGSTCDPAAGSCWIVERALVLGADGAVTEQTDAKCLGTAPAF